MGRGGHLGLQSGTLLRGLSCWPRRRASVSVDHWWGAKRHPTLRLLADGQGIRCSLRGAPSASCRVRQAYAHVARHRQAVHGACGPYQPHLLAVSDVQAHEPARMELGNPQVGPVRIASVKRNSTWRSTNSRAGRLRHPGLTSGTQFRKPPGLLRRRAATPVDWWGAKRHPTLRLLKQRSARRAFTRRAAQSQDRDLGYVLRLLP